MTPLVNGHLYIYIQSSLFLPIRPGPVSAKPARRFREKKKKTNTMKQPRITSKRDPNIHFILQTKQLCTAMKSVTTWFELRGPPWTWNVGILHANVSNIKIPCAVRAFSAFLLRNPELESGKGAQKRVPAPAPLAPKGNTCPSLSCTKILARIRTRRWSRVGPQLDTANFFPLDARGFSASPVRTPATPSATEKVPSTNVGTAAAAAATVQPAGTPFTGKTDAPSTIRQVVTSTTKIYSEARAATQPTPLRTTCCHCRAARRCLANGEL